MHKSQSLSTKNRFYKNQFKFSSSWCWKQKSLFLQLAANGHVYETFGISKHFPVKLQVPIIRAEMLNNALTAKCFIYDVGNWCSFISVCMSFV
jgi:hypothetical protein